MFFTLLKVLSPPFLDDNRFIQALSSELLHGQIYFLE